MDYAGHLAGIDPPPPGGNLRLQPYVVGDASRRDGASGPDRDLSANAGRDLKWAVTSNSVLDLAVNPDFGQTASIARS